MSIIARLREISPSTLEQIKDDSLLMDAFMFLGGSPDSEWHTLELDLHKYWHELHFLLTGTDIMEDSSLSTLTSLVMEKSAWDNRPLINAIFGGNDTAGEAGYGKIKYLLPGEVKEVAEGLLELSETGFQERFIQEFRTEDPVYLIDWTEPEELDWLTDYYRKLTAYYREVSEEGNAMLIYFT